jgi:hypothetical protein
VEGAPQQSVAADREDGMSTMLEAADIRRRAAAYLEVTIPPDCAAGREIDRSHHNREMIVEVMAAFAANFAGDLLVELQGKVEP